MTSTSSPTALQRFPLRKYLRQLRDMRQEVLLWQRQYEAASRTTTSLSLASRFDQRAALLYDTQAQLLHTYLMLEELPRLS